MSIVGVGIVGKQNEPIYTMTELTAFDDNINDSVGSQPPSSSSVIEKESERLHLESILFTSLDVIEVVSLKSINFHSLLNLSTKT